MKKNKYAVGNEGILSDFKLRCKIVGNRSSQGNLTLEALEDFKSDTGGLLWKKGERFQYPGVMFDPDGFPTREEEIAANYAQFLKSRGANLPIVGDGI